MKSLKTLLAAATLVGFAGATMNVAEAAPRHHAPVCKVSKVKTKVRGHWVVKTVRSCR